MPSITHPTVGWARSLLVLAVVLRIGERGGTQLPTHHLHRAVRLPSAPDLRGGRNTNMPGDLIAQSNHSITISEKFYVNLDQQKSTLWK
ncbi:hypothetical protein ILP97_17245 [Amycolatopsis sp. H6(2020)]|nr:hypothetical protein [Amycolatopsis sp. H6(2020)]